MREPSPYLREAAVTLVPSLTDEQLERIDAQLETLANPYLLVSRISEHTALIQGIPVKAGSPVEADANTWETIFMLVTAALRGPFDWDTTITAIDVRDSDGALAS
jgi:hypothetical protein